MIRAIFLIVMTCWAGMAQAQMSALARLTGDGVVLSPDAGGVALRIDMTRAVPWRVFSLADPARLVMDFSELDWTGVDEAALATVDGVGEVRTGLFRPGWSRIVVTLDGPFLVESAGMRKVSEARSEVSVRTVPTDAAAFARTVGAPPSNGSRKARTPSNGRSSPAARSKTTKLVCNCSRWPTTWATSCGGWPCRNRYGTGR